MLGIVCASISLQRVALRESLPSEPRETHALNGLLCLSADLAHVPHSPQRPLSHESVLCNTRGQLLETREQARALKAHRRRRGTAAAM